MPGRRHFEGLDADDPLAGAAARFQLPDGIVYLDGNSLGPLPAHVPAAVEEVVRWQWGEHLITSWNRHGWWHLASRVGDRIAPLIGAQPGSVTVGDTTTVALYKAAAALRRRRPERHVILTDSGNFPTDIYALGSIARQFEAELKVVGPEEVAASVDDDVAVVALTHVDYRSGRRHDLAEITGLAHSAGGLVLWDLSHSAGAMDLDLSEVDAAVGCGYKYLNGGPGAPAFLYVHPALQSDVANPIAGWWGHEEPFAMREYFRPAKGIDRFQIGTQPILSLAALAAALDVFEGVDPLSLRQKSERLTGDFIELVDERVEGFTVASPREAANRGSHVSLAHPEARRIMGALIVGGVIGDFRPPDLLRFGFSPIYQRHVDGWDAVERLRVVMAEERWRHVAESDGPVT